MIRWATSEKEVIRAFLYEIPAATLRRFIKRTIHWSLPIWSFSRVAFATAVEMEVRARRTDSWHLVSASSSKQAARRGTEIVVGVMSLGPEVGGLDRHHETKSAQGVSYAVGYPCLSSEKLRCVCAGETPASLA